MVITKTFKNSEIYSIASDLMDTFQEDMKLPVKINFYLQKNIRAIVKMAQEIEQVGTDIIQKYGTSEDGQHFNFAPEVVEEANKELTDLFDLEQEISVNIISLDAFEDVEMSAAQVNAISWMIEE